MCCGLAHQARDSMFWFKHEKKPKKYHYRHVLNQSHFDEYVSCHDDKGIKRHLFYSEKTNFLVILTYLENRQIYVKKRVLRCLHFLIFLVFGGLPGPAVAGKEDLRTL